MPRHVIADHNAALPDLHRAAARGDAGGVVAAIAAGQSVHTLDGLVGAGALHYAAQSGSVEVVGLLLDHGALPNLQAHSHGMTPLMVAVWHRNPHVVARLLADPLIDVDIRARTGATAESQIGGGFADNDADETIRAHFARWREARPDLPLIAVLEDPELSGADKTARIGDLLTQGADPNETAGFSNIDNPGHTALLIAARDGHAEVVQALLDAGADMTLVDGLMLAHPAHKAAYMGHPEVMRILAAHPDFFKIADSQGPFNGYTALHDAIWHGHAETAEVLLRAEVRTDLKGHDGRTPAELARHGEYADLANDIDERKADDHA